MQRNEVKAYYERMKAEREGKSKHRRLSNPRIMDVLRYIEQYVTTYHLPPSIREIGDACKITSTSVTNFYIAKLVERGYLERQPLIARGLRVTDAGRLALGIQGNYITCPHCGERIALEESRALDVTLAIHASKRAARVATPA